MGLDANEPLSQPSNPVSATFSQISLHDAILTRHGHELAPSTHQRGSAPIDGLFVSAGLEHSATGYLPFGSVAGDHRPLWIDIHLPSVFGGTASECSAAIPTSTARRLQCADPRVVQRYNKVLHQFYQEHDLATRVFRLEVDISQRPWSPALAAEWEAVDALRLAGIQLAESKCRRLRTGALPWSPQLGRALLLHRYWDRLLHRAKGYKVSWRYLCRLSRKLGQTIPTELRVEDLRPQADAAWEAYKNLRRDANSQRTSYLAQLAQARADAGLESQAAAVRVMAQRERKRRDARLLRSIYKAGSRRGLDRVEIPVGDGEWLDGEWTGEWREVTNKHDIEKGCLQENDRRFRQATGTDLVTPTAVECLGPTGCSAAATHLLKTGEIPWSLQESISHAASSYLAHRRIPSVLSLSSSANLDFHTPAYATGWEKMREHTASGKSGLHFGHFIAQARDPLLCAVDAAMARIPTQVGYVPNRWTYGLNVMLEKKPGVAKVSKLRTILLYEADYNQNNKIMGRAMMAYAEKHNLLAPEQYGSRKHHSAIYQGLNKVLTFNLFRQQRR